LDYLDTRFDRHSFLSSHDSYAYKYQSMGIHQDADETGLWTAPNQSIDMSLLVVQAAGNTERVTVLILYQAKDGNYSRLGVFQCPCTGQGVQSFPEKARRFMKGSKQAIVII
jgi:hypothetical protein